MRKKRSPARPDGAEIARLRERLEEAEQTLDAIRKGNVDALVISGPQGERVFTLEGADYRYRRLIETMKEGAAIIGRDGCVVYANQRMAEMLGTGLSKVLAARIEAFVATGSRRVFQALVREGVFRPTKAEVFFVRGAGLVPTYVSATPTGDDDGGVCVVVTDLTEQKRSEEILAAERLATSILEQAAEAVVVCSPDRRIVRASRAALRLAETDPLLREFGEVFPIRLSGAKGDGADGKGAREFLEEVIDGAVVSGAEAILALGASGLRHLVVSAAPLANAKGEIFGCVISLTDVTERKIAEGKLIELAHRERVRVEEANRAKDEFLATVSHELRTPLNAILGWARILRSGEIPHDKRERALETIERNAVMQAQIIDDLLDISRIVSGNLRLEARDVNMGVVVQAAIDSVKPLAQVKGVALEASVEPESGPIVGDADRLQQVVWNLLTNAIKFTPAGGHVRASLEVIDGHVHVDVTDDGRGISPQFLPHVFERFRQADGGSTRAHGGLGIGLTIVKKLVELHDGTIEVRSDGDMRGATFLVRIPSAGTKADGVAAPVKPARLFRETDDLAGTHLLVVDDDRDGRELVAEVLRECRAEVRVAESAAVAFDAMQRETFDALLSDIGMPGEDGYSLIARVRTLPVEKNGRVPALALTAFARGEDRRRALLAGFDGHLPKPVEPNELVLVLSNLIRRA
ncbi:MAG TPA: ATP-binding protein [Polyangiaceae bacterium]|jgi:PAS domain S-box-containing protein|nr:ATP-binding protein [Polyangiaceae bacterium]